MKRWLPLLVLGGAAALLLQRSRENVEQPAGPHRCAVSLADEGPVLVGHGLRSDDDSSIEQATVGDRSTGLARAQGKTVRVEVRAVDAEGTDLPLIQISCRTEGATGLHIGWTGRWDLEPGTHSFTALGFESTPPVEVLVMDSAEPAAAVLRLLDAQRVTGRVRFPSNEVARWDGFAIVAYGPEHIRREDAFQRWEAIWNCDEPPPEPRKARLDADGSFELTLPSSWKPLELAIGTPCMGGFHVVSDLEWEVARSRFDDATVPLTLDIGTETFGGLRVMGPPGLTADEPLALWIVLKDTEGHAIHAGQEWREEGYVVFFPVPVGTWTVELRLGNDEASLITETVRDVSVSAAEWPRLKPAWEWPERTDHR